MGNRDIRDDPAKTGSPPRMGDNESTGTDKRGPERIENESRVRTTEGETSWTSVVLGWLTALGASVILAGIVSGIVSAMIGVGPTVRSAATESGLTALVGLLITLFLAFLIGGYAAGRMASRSGPKHGLLVATLSLLVTLVLAGAGALLGSSFIDSLSGVTLPKLPADVPRQSLDTILTVSGLLALLFPFISGALGGWWGAKTGRQRP